MKLKSKRINFRINEKSYRLLMELAKESEKDFSSYIRDMIEERVASERLKSLITTLVEENGKILDLAKAQINRNMSFNLADPCSKK